MTNRSSITKEEIAKGYDDIAEIVGVGGTFYDDCLSVQKQFSGTVLDVGCGRGLLLQKIAERATLGTKLYGIDISPKLCDLARQNNPGADILVGDAEALPYPDHFFDTVCMTEVFEHMTDFHKPLAEARRVLKPSGTFIISVPNRDWASYDFYDQRRNHEFQPVDDHYFRFEEITGLLKDHGFHIQTYKGLDNLYYYGWKHKVEEFVAFFLPFLHKKMKRLVFKTTV
ncbi:MAG: class I SAM-dependent methyltransferase [Candidatus Pacebacteria bacterium]|nr:class I SAM-dependent methyltransferase [Candidatus Paceibacterota bacterium]